VRPGKSRILITQGDAWSELKLVAIFVSKMVAIHILMSLRSGNLVEIMTRRLGVISIDRD
jgi:hypothetical protein